MLPQGGQSEWRKKRSLIWYWIAINANAELTTLTRYLQILFYALFTDFYSKLVVEWVQLSWISFAIVCVCVSNISDGCKAIVASRKHLVGRWLWSSTIFDVSAINAFVVWKELNPSWETGKNFQRRLFLEQLGKLWCALTRRDDNTSLCHTTEDNTRFLWSSRPLSTEPQPSEKKTSGMSTDQIEKHCIKSKRATYTAQTIYLCQMCTDVQRLLYTTLLLILFVVICSWSTFWTVLFGLLDYVFHVIFYRLLMLLCSTYVVLHNILNVIVKNYSFQMFMLYSW